MGAGVHALLKHDFATGMANATRHPVKGVTDPSGVATLPGERIILDGYDPVSTPSVVDGSIYLCYCAVDEVTDFAIVLPVKFHGSSTWLVLDSSCAA